MEGTGSGEKHNQMFSSRLDYSEGLRKNQIESMILKKRAFMIRNSYNREDEQIKFDKFAANAAFLGEMKGELEVEDAGLAGHQDQVESLSLILEEYPIDKFAMVLFEHKAHLILLMYLQAILQKGRDFDLIRGAKHALNIIAILMEIHERYFDRLDHEAQLAALFLDMLNSDYLPPAVLSTLIECMGNMARLRSRTTSWIYPNQVYNKIHRLLSEIPRRCIIIEGGGIPIGGITSSSIKIDDWVQLYSLGMWAIEKMLPHNQGLDNFKYEDCMLEIGSIVNKVLKLNMEPSTFFCLRILKEVFQHFTAEVLGPESYDILPDELPQQLVKCYKETLSVPLKIQVIGILGVFLQEEYGEQAREVLSSNIQVQLKHDLFNEPTGFSKSDKATSLMESELDEKTGQLSVLNHKSPQYLEYVELSEAILIFLRKFVEFLDDDHIMQLLEELEFKSLIINALILFADKKALLEQVVDLLETLVHELRYPEVLKLIFEENDCQTFVEIAKIATAEAEAGTNTNLLARSLDCLQSMVMSETEHDPSAKHLYEKLKSNMSLMQALEVCIRHPNDNINQVAFDLQQMLTTSDQKDA